MDDEGFWVVKKTYEWTIFELQPSTREKDEINFFITKRKDEKE